MLCGIKSLVRCFILSHKKSSPASNLFFNIPRAFFFISLGSLLDRMHLVDDSGFADTRCWIWLTWRFFLIKKIWEVHARLKGVSETDNWGFVKVNLLPESWLKCYSIFPCNTFLIISSKFYYICIYIYIYLF